MTDSLKNGLSDDRTLTDSLDRLTQQRALALVRADSFALGQRLAELAIAAGLTSIEIAWNGTESAQTIAALREKFPHCQIGAGTVLTVEQVREAIAAGAQFLFSPHTDERAIETARSADVLCIPGALTPTEIHRARAAGAIAIKVFPIASVGGVEYLRALRAPLPNVPFVPTGGISIATATSYIEAGAVAVALSGDLFPHELVRHQNWTAIEARIRRFAIDLERFSHP